ncbi:NAD dependent epimerase/dehydratase [Bifidobacterium animalis subsp. animalis MCC 0499]|uniref:NAD-dependent epimerase/dehydratase family protein n=1 Tax=Bifidobacterium animalis TaxID=28025 RepID=UPI00069A7CB2|nr:NAD-dependent epimerase/dehydratase family protein [Bifidobacterium animalis]KOA58815.1 NAD dependent epimerase/dehydratase [Bifidobacterium animalis subsp. animalis MCC 0499]
MSKESVDLNNKTILITGAAGFIGSNLAMRLLDATEGSTIIGLDCLTDYNPVELKEWRLQQIEEKSKTSTSTFEFIKGDMADKDLIFSLFEKYHFAIVVNLAAQAGVRYSIDHPDTYIHSNIIGFYNILEACRHYPVEHLVYASSSSVYGGNKKVPFSTDNKVDNPVSLYAATKKSNELFAHAYSKLYNIPSTGLRFFTVYGPAGRTDMFYFSATNKLREGGTIKIFNYGNCSRDFTYIDDIVEGVVRVMQGAPEKRNGEDGLPIPPYAVYNIGGGTPENLLDYITTLQEELVRAGVLPEDYDFDAHKELVPMQPGDVPVTYADSSALEHDYGFRPKIGIQTGLRRFAEWYKNFYM